MTTSTTFTVADARGFAREAHEGQTYGGASYFVGHLEVVAYALAPFGPHAEMAGYLHDIVEDTPVTFEFLFDAGAPADVIAAVDAVTRRRRETYDALITRAIAEPLGRLVKLADNTANLFANTDLMRTDPVRARSLREGRYLPARRRLLSGMAITGGELLDIERRVYVALTDARARG